MYTQKKLCIDNFTRFVFVPPEVEKDRFGTPEMVKTCTIIYKDLSRSKWGELYKTTGSHQIAKMQSDIDINIVTGDHWWKPDLLLLKCSKHT